ncbi:MFS transporter [Roseicella sp. DB1501]|uniref:MFS transporter n=1 Tax=Roseicella sp. DB1501 TaxID=2730925 RepID=UPI0014921025|nr:MFS transporter [Roseicella sp. DB1501]NOG73540.1 MFS transporter [Roseicella sp. DB1501]
MAEPHRRTSVVIALGTAQTLAWGSTYYLPAVLAQPMAREFGVSPSWIFGAFSAALIVSALFGPAAGRAIDARGGRGVLAISNLVFAAGLLLMATASQVWMLAAGWLVLGIGMSMGLYDAAFAALAYLYGREARGPITGITLIAGFASTVGWPLSALFEAEFGWRGACLFWAAVQLCVALPINRFLLPATPAPASASPITNTTAEATASGGTAPRHAMMLLAFVFSAAWFVTGAMAAHLPHLLEASGATPAAAIAAAALVGPAQVVARVAEFGFLRKAHPLISARLACIAHPIGAAALFLFGAPAAVAFVLLHGAGNGVLTIVKGTLPLAIFGPDGYGLRQGLLGAPSRFVQACAPLLFGLLIDVYGAASVAISAACCLLAFGALMALRPALSVASARLPT